ncbi:MAG: bacterial Ig-like domain-containing protein [Erysipelotrichales bacterium]|nr:bacterial Ig-like domain-containing protein [Erysipelotrichales bacterium]
MKRKTKILALFGLIFSIFMGVNNKQIIDVKADSKSYNIDSFTQMPEDWTIYKRSDVNYSSQQVVNNELVLSHFNESGTQADKYYGSVYLFNTEAYTDFTFSMEFSLESALNTSRFIGLLWHANEVNDYLNSLYMNYRVSGETASSVICGSGSFKDDTSKKGPVVLSDGKYHELKVIMIDDTVYQYIDNNLLTTYSVEPKYADNLLTSSFPKDGGFGILVNKSTIKIKNIHISDIPEDPSTIVPDVPENRPIKDNELASTYQMETALVNFPTVVADLKTKSDLLAIESNQAKPSNAILRMNADQDIVDINNNKIDSFENIFKNTLKKQIIPIVRVEDTQSADALIRYLNNEIDILDMAVMSSKPELVKKVRTAKTHIRGIISFENSNLTMIQIVQTLNMNYATIAVFSEDMATIDNVFYVQARFKTVWVNMADSATDFNICNAINSSCYGIIAKDYNNVYDAYKTYDSTAFIHPVFNAAHRGLPKKYHENSVSGVKAAIAAGATHLEIDCYLTTDNKVVLMHDANIARTTNGEGNIEDLSLEQLRQYKLDAAKDPTQPLEEIPILEDVIEAMQGSDAVLILEIKSSKIAIVDYIREVLETYDFFDQVIFISFNIDNIGKLKVVIPECPTAWLGGIIASNFASRLEYMGDYNTLFDTEYSYNNGTNKSFNQKYLRDRGIIGWFWTFDGIGQLEGIANSNGFLGVTNNDADYYSDKVKFVRGVSTTLEKGQNITDLETLKIEVENYNGDKKLVDGKIVSYEEKDTHYNVICSYFVDGGFKKTYYTQAFVVYKYSVITSIEIETAPKIEFDYGEDFSVNGGKIKINYSNGTSEIIDMDITMVSTIPDMTQVGTKKILVEYEGETTSYFITIKEVPVVITSIEIEKTPKSEFEYDEGFSVDGGKIKINYSNGTSTIVDMNISMILNIPDMTQAGTKEIIVEYEGKTTSYVITVKEEPVVITSIEIETTPTIEFECGEEFSVTGGKIKINYSNGISEVIDMDITMISNIPNMEEVGTKEITVTYEGYETSYSIVIKETQTPGPGIDQEVPPTNNDGKVAKIISFVSLGIASISIIFNIVLVILLKKKRA